MSTDDGHRADHNTVSERRADEDAGLLSILYRHLADDGIRCRIFKRVRLAIGTETIPPRRAYNPTEMVVYGPDGLGRAKVTVRTRVWGTAFLVTPARDLPEFQFPINQISEILRWLAQLSRDDLHVRPPTARPTS
ncbi:hypothetical protein [Sphaerisporangium corydalis]|uniref:Uncharacterized protein n=1 Tax=Sphaerisporangium corydalis TaxID=1441875 RepID=A0ABV9EFB8_9ACTN|nr:hypothetical protein [Sphaerisporangium corydalis]